MKIINHRTLVSHNVAILAKEKGFVYPCTDGYNIDGTKLYILEELQAEENIFDNWNNIDNWPETINSCCISAPEQYLLQKWLREIHNIDIFILKYIGGGSGIDEVYEVKLYKLSTSEEYFEKLLNHCYHTYEQALDEALFQALNLIK